MDTDTEPMTVPAAPGPNTAPTGGGLDLGAMFGGLDLGAMLAGMGVDLPDPDSTTLDELADDLAELTARVDWLAGALLAVAQTVPARFRPELPDYPPPVVD